MAEFTASSHDDGQTDDERVTERIAENPKGEGTGKKKEISTMVRFAMLQLRSLNSTILCRTQLSSTQLNSTQRNSAQPNPQPQPNTRHKV